MTIEVGGCASISHMGCAEEFHVGGRLRLFLHEWQQITSDLFILHGIMGYKIVFLADTVPPRQDMPRPAYIRSKKETLDMQAERHCIKKE